jgi:shikimate kinase
MGSGKTTLAQNLSRILEFEYIDTDENIESVTGISPFELIANKGEQAFRKIELSVVESILKDPPPIIAFGGGTLHFLKDPSLILGPHCLVYLKASFQTVMNRVDHSERPLLKNGKRLYDSRIPLFNQVEYHVNVDGKSIKDCCDEIIDIWENHAL